MGGVLASKMKSEDEFDGLTAVEQILGYHFRQPGLVVEALTHPSYCLPSKGASYERLEYVGDAVLNCVIAREFFSSYLDLGPGPLTKLRAANVDTEKLARAAVKHGLHRHLRYRSDQLQRQIDEFIDEVAEYPIHSNGLITTPKFLADFVEALLGAVFVDSDYNINKVWEVSKKLLKPMTRPETLKEHPVAQLNELCQKRRLRLTFEDTWKENMTIRVVINGHVISSATYGHRKETAQNRAAKVAVNNLTDNLLQFLDELKEDVSPKMEN